MVMDADLVTDVVAVDLGARSHEVRIEPRPDRPRRGGDRPLLRRKRVAVITDTRWRPSPAAPRRRA